MEGIGSCLFLLVLLVFVIWVRSRKMNAAIFYDFMIFYNFSPNPIKFYMPKYSPGQSICLFSSQFFFWLCTVHIWDIWCKNLLHTCIFERSTMGTFQTTQTDSQISIFVCFHSLHSQITRSSLRVEKIRKYFIYTYHCHCHTHPISLSTLWTPA